jgi:hypothetical protein
MHIQTIKQNMHTIFVKKTKKTLSYLNLSMKFKTKLNMKAIKTQQCIRWFSRAERSNEKPY